MTEKQLAAALATALRARTKKARELGTQFHVEQMARAAFREDHGLPIGVYTAAYGLAYALQTARVDGQLAIYLERAMLPTQLCRLVARLAARPEVVIGDVPGWLTENRDAILAGW